MDKLDYEALTASVAKWRRNATVSPEQGTVGASDCPLCRLHAGNGCEGCPVAEATGLSYCGGTPYGRASSALGGWFNEGEATTMREHFDKVWREQAQREADFLASLVPAGGPTEE